MGSSATSGCLCIALVVGVGSSPLMDGQLGALRGYPPLEWGGGEACFAARGKAFPLLIWGGLVLLPVLVNLPVLLNLGEVLLQLKPLKLLAISKRNGLRNPLKLLAIRVFVLELERLKPQNLGDVWRIHKPLKMRAIPII